MNFISIQKISNKEAWLIRGILAGIIIYGLLTVFFYPLNFLHKLFPSLFSESSSCIMLNVFGIRCPFCGMSHALVEFFTLNFGMSIYYNPSSVIFFTFLTLTSLGIFVLSLFNYKIVIRFNRATMLIALILFIAMWLLNIYCGHS